MLRMLPGPLSVLVGGTLSLVLTACQGAGASAVLSSTGSAGATASAASSVTGASASLLMSTGPTTSASGKGGTLASATRAPTSSGSVSLATTSSSAPLATTSAKVASAQSNAAARVAPAVAATTKPAAAPTAAPAANQQSNQQGGADAAGAKTGGEGGATGAEGAASGPSVTNPGGLPASPPTNDPTINQMGQEQLVLYRDPQNRYQVSFVSTWQRQTGTTADTVLSRQGDRTISVAPMSSGGKSATALAQADAAQFKASLAGYQQLALRPGTIPYGPVMTLIYRYTQGANAVTGKGNAFIAARVYVARARSTTDMAVVTVSAPAAFYGDLTQIFDPVVASFRWR